MSTTHSGDSTGKEGVEGNSLRVYEDNSNFDELTRGYSFSGNKNDQSEVNNTGISTCLMQFIQAKYGTMKNFYNPQLIQDDKTVNGFTRIEKLRKALGALDRSGWDHSYHQRIFHVISVYSAMMLCLI